MAIFTAAATFLLAGTALAGTFAVTALATGLSLAASIGLSYAAKALSGDPNKSAEDTGVNGVQGTLQAGADVPRSFNLGYSVTAGSLVYANTWSNVGNGTPNAFLTQVIALADLPGGELLEVWVNGELCTLGAIVDTNLGAPVTQYNKDGQDKLWIKYYDGTQTAADVLCTNFASSAARPYESTRVGKGVAYVVATSYVEDTLFTGFPTFKFAVSGIPLYDPTKDSTNGGSGSHRWSNPATWGGDGDDFPVVQAYNILRGIYFDGTWLYGLQRMTSARLPAVNWNAQVSKCRASIEGVSGNEPSYRTGGQVSVNAQVVRTIEALLTGCQGRLSEIGGFYKIHVGAPETPTFSFQDADILSSEEQTFSPFFGLADSINGITATYPSPVEGWNTKPAPPLFDPDYEVEDGDRRLLASPVFDFVPYDAQVQRLQKSALLEARRARRHTIVLPPAFWIVEPGDVGEWTSLRNGYETKQFRVDGMTDRANLDVLFDLTEVDPTDYDWDHNTDYTGVTVGPTTLPRPAPQGVVDWFVEPYTLQDDSGIARRAAIRLSWDGSMPGVVGVQYEVRLQADNTVVTRGRTDQLSVGAIIVSQSLIGNTAYEARGQYLPSAPRDMLWSDWLPVTTPDIDVTLVDFEEGLRDLVTDQFNQGNATVAQIEDLIATLTADQDAANRIEKINNRTLLEYREAALNDTITGAAQELSASIEEVSTIAASTSSILASYQVTVNTALGSLGSSVSTNATSISNLNASFSSFTTTTTAHFNTLTASVTTNSTAVASINGRLATAYSVLLDVNGYQSGFRSLNDGDTSSFIINANLFQVATSGVAPKTVFQISTVAGATTIAFRGNMLADGDITARNIAAGQITAVKMAAGSITADNAAISSLAVKSLNIGDNAVTVPLSASSGSAFGGSAARQTVLSMTYTIDTTGLSGKTIKVYIHFSGQQATSGGSTWAVFINANGSDIASATGSQFQPNFSIGGEYSFTASGGSQSFNISAAWIGASMTMFTRSLVALGTKR